MTNTEIKKMLENLHQTSIQAKYSECALSAVETILTEYTLDEYTPEDMAYQEAENQMIYYSQAFNYLMDENIVDYQDAIENGCCKTISEIAVWYLTEEILNLINELSK